MEKTYLMVKPDGVQRGLIGRIVARFEDKGFKLVAAKLITVSEDQAKRHYAEHAGKDFFQSWSLSSLQVQCLQWYGKAMMS